MEQLILGEAVLTTDENELDFQAFVHDHARHIFRVAYAVLRNHHDAEDAVQEAFLRFLRLGRKWAEVRNPRAWLSRTVWRVAVDRRRKTEPVSMEEVAGAIETLRAQGASVEELAARGETLELVERLAASLPRQLRDPLVLSTVEEMTSAEIGEVLGLPEGSVRRRVAQARAMLHEKLAGWLEKNRVR